MFFGYRTVERNELIEFLECGHHNRRDIRIVFYTIRMELDKAVAATEEHFTFLVFVTRGKSTLPYREAVAGVIISEGAILGLEPRKPIGSAQPEAALAIIEDCVDEIIRKTVFDAESSKRPCFLSSLKSPSSVPTQITPRRSSHNDKVPGATKPPGAFLALLSRTNCVHVSERLS